MNGFRDRQIWDAGSWPELFGLVQQMQHLVFTSPPGIEMNLMVFTVASTASGCRHCQAHGSVGLTRAAGATPERVRELSSFETSEAFTEREVAALRFAQGAGSTPNAVTPEHHEALRENFSDQEVRTLLAVAAVSGWMNRFNDSLATVTDNGSAVWAAEHLGSVGWELGKHAGADDERRPEMFAGASAEATEDDDEHAVADEQREN
jgi:Carboxymuconolactone decarboxylase family